MRSGHAGFEHEGKLNTRLCLSSQANAYFDTLFDFAVRSASLSPPVRTLSLLDTWEL